MHPKLLYFRYKLFRYRAIEQTVADDSNQLLDIGCGDGENLLRFRQPALQKTGIEVSWPRLRAARGHGLNVEQASATALPFAAGTFDMIYTAHVLHHVADYRLALKEIRRVLRDDGRIFIVETTTDNPLLRLGRRLHPFWQGDAVEADWRFDELVALLQRDGFSVQRSGRYNVIFWLWEMAPLAFWPFELFTPLFVALDLLLARFWKRHSAHCYLILQKQDL